MEKIIDIDERIRRAEELYNRRKMQGGIRVSTNNVNNRTNFVLLKRLIIRIIICTIIYAIFFFLKNSGMFFSKNIIEQTQKIMSYDINVNYAFSQALEVYNKIIGFNNVSSQEQIDNINQVEEAQKSSQANESENVNTNEINQEQINTTSNLEEQIGIGGASEENSEISLIEQNPANTSVIEKTQMEIDAEYVIANYSFIKPVQGIVTSRFGNREATEIVSANHKGIDIGANTGTPIYASMEGIVTKVSSYGDYGKHLEITNRDVVTLYAHCSEITVSEGQYISQAQEIAKVGSTGRATGPHLHFEIKRDGRVINPDYIISF